MEVTEIHIETVRVVGRHRKDLGDIASLARSIEELNLIHPITITEDGHLVAGQRRLEAFRLLGRATIPARIVSDLTEAAERLRIERDENTERKEMTPEELVSVGRKLEELMRPKAEDRKREGRARGTKALVTGVTKANDVEGWSAVNSGKTDAVVGSAIGMDRMSYYRAKRVVDVATDPDLQPEDREAARDVLEEMNATGKIRSAYEKAQKIRKKTAGEAIDGDPIDGGDHAKVTIDSATRQRKAIVSAIATLSGVAHGFDQITTVHTDITNEEAAQWVSGLSDARRSITALISRLKERTNGQL